MWRACAWRPGPPAACVGMIVLLADASARAAQPATPLIDLPPVLVRLLERRMAHERLIGAFDLLREATLAAAALVIGFALLGLAWKELRRRALVIEVFDVPPSLAAQGWSGVVAARRLHDQLVAVREHVVTSVEKRSLAQAAGGTGSDIAMPGAHVSLATIFAYLRAALGRDTYVAGEITEDGDRVSVGVRVRDRPAASFDGARGGLDTLLRHAAEHVLLHTEPFIAAMHRWHDGDHAGAVAAVRVCADAANRREASNALNLWGEILFEQGDRASALTRYDAALRRDPDNQWSYVNRMVALTSAGSWPEAEHVVATYLRRAPRSPLAFALVAQTAIYRADVLTVERAGRQGRERDPRDAGAGVTLGFAALFRHDYAAARDITERMAQDRRTRFTENTINARVTVLAWSLTGLHEYSRARDLADELRATRAGYHGGWLRTGHLHLRAHEYDLAVAPLRRAARWGTRAVGGTELLARALHRAEGPKAALAYAATAIAENPQDPCLLVAWGDILLEEDDPAAALHKFRDAAALSTGYPDPYEGWARALAATGDTTAALSRLDQTIALAPKWAAPQLVWGDILARSGDSEGAIARYRRAIALDPAGAGAYARWGALLDSTGDRTGAAEKYAAARRLDPTNPAWRDMPDGLSVAQRRPTPCGTEPATKGLLDPAAAGGQH